MTTSLDFRSKLIDLFLKKNAEVNLSALRTEEDVLQKHIFDSLIVEKALSFTPGSCIADVGTGGGFPLLPLAMHHPDCCFVGIDSRKKKTRAVQEIADGLGLDNVELVRSRIEDHTQRYDYVTARAVAYADKLIQWCAPLLAKGGTLILYKKRDKKEKQILLREAKKHHLTLVKEHHYSLFDGDIERVLYLLCSP